MRWLVAVVMLLAGLSGCLASDGDVPEEAGTDSTRDAAPQVGSPPTPAPVKKIEPASPETEPLEHLGQASREYRVFAKQCPCPDVTLELPNDLPSDGWLEIRVRWDGTATTGFSAAITDGESVWQSQRGFDATRIKVPAAEAGNYTLRVQGNGQLEGEFFWRAASLPKTVSEHRLPNIVTMVPRQIAFGPCDEYERTEKGAVTCLRLGNAIGNVGDGPLEVHLDYPNSALALAGEAQPVVDGFFAQRLYKWTGVAEDAAVGAADFHTAHAHWHYDGFAVFEMFPINTETGLRGEVAATGHKSGFCFLDWGRMVERETTENAGGRAAQECLVPTETGWSMGVTAGYFDFYWAGLSDQYVEASEVTDGVYELVSTADFDNWLEEVDDLDNSASVLIRITGTTVQVLDERGWYIIPEGTSQL